MLPLALGQIAKEASASRFVAAHRSGSAGTGFFVRRPEPRRAARWWRFRVEDGEGCACTPMRPDARAPLGLFSFIFNLSTILGDVRASDERNVGAPALLRGPCSGARVRRAPCGRASAPRRWSSEGGTQSLPRHGSILEFGVFEGASLRNLSRCIDDPTTLSTASTLSKACQRSGEKGSIQVRFLRRDTCPKSPTIAYCTRGCLKIQSRRSCEKIKNRWPTYTWTPSC